MRSRTRTDRNPLEKAPAEGAPQRALLTNEALSAAVPTIFAAVHTVLQSVETIFKSVSRAKVDSAVAAVFPTVHPIL